MKTFGMDDGYGEIKVGNGEHFQALPSKAVRGKVVRSQYAAGEFHVAGAPVLESENALFTLQDAANVEDTRFDGWPHSAMNRVLCRYAASTLGFQDGDNIVTGLPMSVYFDRDGQVNQAAIQRRCTSLKLPVMQHMPDGMIRHLATPGRIKVLPQGMAAIFDAILDLPAHETLPDMVGVVDIGSRTTDVAVYAMQDADNGGSIEVSRSGGFQKGVSNLVELLAQALQQSLRLPALPPLSTVTQSLKTGQFKAAGKSYNVETERAQVMRMGITEILQDAERILSAGMGLSGLMDLDRILIVGGGARILEKVQVKTWDQAWIPDEPEMANVRGMVKLGQRLR
ncbi:ParM/StbA family protein [Acidithiobacillus thiooxidans]|uniref:ParM/StbA family protein n=1 Tax=Acidithiobacillus TaxID=119977 RepID=UPI0002624BF7|nr:MULTISPECIES: ParM/StbA family protein [Acidithiobacillus]MBU2742683.1 ParM/StbA family protein [Acidithiobacillus albertensis]MBU2752326.1 ParM/StbA family protein [Acidithiobacillus thiooxidans]MBU2812023.1 ParM/StbA family protein [Acidithiobacillus thiooxidans]MBU2836930.1 ParM/StbA family protein [Acidithiobacillus thiooxidans]